MSFLMSSVEPSVQVCYEGNVFGVGEFVASLAEPFPLHVVVIVFKLILVLVNEKNDVILCHHCILDL